MEWGKYKERGEEDWTVGKEDVLSSIKVEHSDYLFKDEENMKENRRKIIHFGRDKSATCIINKSFEEVCDYYIH